MHIIGVASAVGFFDNMENMDISLEIRLDLADTGLNSSKVIEG